MRREPCLVEKRRVFIKNYIRSRAPGTTIDESVEELRLKLFLSKQTILNDYVGYTPPPRNKKKSKNKKR